MFQTTLRIKLPHLCSSGKKLQPKSYKQCLSTSPLSLSTIGDKQWLTAKQSSFEARSFSQSFSYYEKIGDGSKSTSSSTTSSSDSFKSSEPQQSSKRAQIRKAIAEYGMIVIVMSQVVGAASLGICYCLVSVGIDVQACLSLVGAPDNKISTEAPYLNAGECYKAQIWCGVSTLAVAYALHKPFAPLRIGIVLAVTPPLVRWWRQLDILKKLKQRLKR